MDAGAAYFEAILRFNKMEAQIRELEKKQQKIHYEAVLNAGSLRTQLNRSLSSLNRSVDISANVTVQGLDKLRSSYGTFATFAGNALNDALQKSLDIAAQGVNAVVGAGIGFSRDSIQSFADVSGQLNLIQQKAAASDAQIQALQKSIISVASDTSGTPQSLVALSDTLVQSGRTISEVQNLLRSVTVGSSALNRESSALAGDTVLLADSLKLDLSDLKIAKTIIDTIGSASLSANVTATQLAQSIRFFRSQQSGLEGLQNTFSVLALGAAGGLTGSRAGTNFNRLFVQSIKNSEDVLKTFGVRVKDSQGNLRGELDILRDLSRAYNDLAQSQGTAVAVEEANRLFQVQGSRALQSVAKITEEQFEQISKSAARGITEGGISDSLGESQLKGLAGAFLSLENNIAAVQFSLGEKLSPAVEQIVRSVVTVIKTIADNTALLDSIGESAQRFADALASPAAQTALENVGKIFGDLLLQGIVFLTDKVNEISATIAANPAILEQIASAIAPLVSIEGIVSTLKLVISNTIELAGTFFEAFNQGAGESVLSINNIQAGISSIFDILQPVAALFGGISGVISQIAIALIDIVQNSGVQEFLGNLTSSITSITGQVQSTIPRLVGTITSTLGAFAGGIGSGIGRVGIEAPNFELPSLDLSSTVRGFGEVLGEVGANVFNLISRISEIIVNSVLPSIIRIGQALAPVATSLLATVFELVKQLTPLIEKIVNGMIGFIDSNLPGLQSFLLQAVDLISQVSSFVIGIVTQLVEGVASSQLINTLWLGIRDFVSAIGLSVANLFAIVTNNFSQMEGLKSLVQSLASLVGSIAGGVLSVSTNLVSTVSQSQQLGETLSNTFSFIDYIAGSLAGFASEVERIFTSMEFFSRVGEQINIFFTNLQIALGNLISSFTESLKPSIEPFLQQVQSSLPNILALIQRLFEWAGTLSTTLAPIGTFVGTTLGTAAGVLFRITGFVVQLIGDISGLIVQNEALNENVESLSGIVRNIFGFFTKIVQKLGEFLTAYYDRLFPALRDTISNVVTIGLNINEFITTPVRLIWNLMQNVGGWIQKTKTETIPSLAQSVQNFWDSSYQRWMEFWNSITEWFTVTLPSQIVNTYNNAINTVKSIGEYVSNWFSFVVAWISEKLTEVVQGAYNFVTNTIKTIGEYISGWFNFLVTWISESFTSIVTQAYEFVTNIVKTIGEFVSSWFDFVVSWIGETLLNIVKGAYDFIVNTIKAIGEFVSSWFNYAFGWITTTLPESVSNTYDSIVNWIGSLGKYVSDWFAWAINWLVKTLPETIVNLYNRVVDWIKGIFDYLKQWLDFIWKWLSEEVPKILQQVYDNTVKKVFEAFDYLWKKIGEIKNWLTGGFFGTLDQASKGITDKIGGAIDFVSKAWNVFGNAVGSVGDAITGLAGGSSSSGTSSSGQPKGADANRIQEALGGNRPVRRGSNEQIFSQAGLGDGLISLVKALEGYHQQAYRDGRQNSIGFGTKATSLSETITVERANERLRDELLKAQREVEQIVVKGYGRSLTQNQKDALTSFAYNLGGGALRQLYDNGRRSNAVVAEKIKLYNKADLLDGRGMRTLEGLRIRRNVESDLFKGKFGGVQSSQQKQADDINKLFTSLGNSVQSLAKIELPTLRINTLPGLQGFGDPRDGGRRQHAGIDSDYINDSSVGVQTTLGGEIIRVASQRDTNGRLTGYGHYIDVYNKALGVVERIAEFDKPRFSTSDVGKNIQAGAVVGTGTTFRGADHREIRNISEYQRQPFGYSSARDPESYLIGLGLYTRDSRGFLVPTGKSISQQSRVGYGGAVDTIEIANSLANQLLSSQQVSSSVRADLTDSLATALTSIDQSLLNNIGTTTIPGTTASTSEVFALMLEQLLLLNKTLERVANFTDMLSEYIISIQDSVERVKSSVRAGLGVELLPNSERNFLLMNYLRQILYSSKLTGDELDKFLVQQQGVTGVSSEGGINQSEERPLTFVDAIAAISEYARRIYEMLAQKMGDSIYTPGVGDASLSQGDANPLLATANNIYEILRKYYQQAEEQKEKLAEYYNLEDIQQKVPQVAELFVQSLEQAFVNRINAAIPDFSFDKITERINSVLSGSEASAERTRSTSNEQQATTVTSPGTTPNGNRTYTVRIETVGRAGAADNDLVTVGELKRSLDEFADYVNNDFSIDLSNQTLEKLRRNPSLRSYILDA